MTRKAEKNELDVILAVYDKARAFMRSNGNMNQWINGYPSRDILEKDIENGNLFVLYDDSSVYGVFMFRKGHDRTYDIIRDGSWMDDSEYGVIHRIASDGTHKGVLGEALRFVSSFTDHLRIDTHSDNMPMQNALRKEGFTRCGIIVCDDGTDRIAFERLQHKAL